MINYHIIVLRLIGLIMFALFMAYALAEHFNVHGCMLCQYQRFLYIAILFCSGVGMMFIILADVMLVLISIMFLCISFMSGYQIMLENGLIDPLFRCSSIDMSTIGDIASFQAAIQNASHDTTCGKPLYVFYFVSLSGFSFIFSVGMFIFVTVFTMTAIFFKYDQNKFSKKIST
ncbi:MAG: disulfide bond formation protein B [Alphaproteobacteria bacterium]